MYAYYEMYMHMLVQGFCTWYMMKCDMNTLGTGHGRLGTLDIPKEVI